MDYKTSQEWLSQRPKLAFEKGVARVRWLLEQLGNPQKKCMTVHVVGTNGKGSTLAFLENILRCAGYCVGRFTSPSIIEDREQIVVDGQMISEEQFAAILTDVRALSDRLVLEMDLGEASDFELLVVVFFIYCTQYKQTDILLVEAGMGGLLDATNVLSPTAVICPSIGLEHQTFLGKTHVDIARHKAGVLRKGVPFYYASHRTDVQIVFETIASELSCPTYLLGRDIVLSSHGEQFTVDNLENLTMIMKGEHQRENAALAIAVAKGLRAYFLRLSDSSIRKGVATAVWPGRLEWLSETLLIDGAHNHEGVASLCHYLESLSLGGSIRVLFAAIHTKPVSEMLLQLGRIAEVSVTSFDDERALRLEDYPVEYHQVKDFREWLTERDRASLSVVTGSLYFIKQVRKEYLRHYKKDV